jgi:hypothetical protein
MNYTFEIVGVSPVLHFFHEQQQLIARSPAPQIEYIGSYHCQLDAMLTSIEPVISRHNWSWDDIAATVVNFWVKNAESIAFWSNRLLDAGSDSLLVSRLGHAAGLRQELESLWQR